MRSRGVSLVLDPLAPPPGRAQAWERIEAHAEAAVILKPDHVRDVDLFDALVRVPCVRLCCSGPATCRRPRWRRSTRGELPGGLLACRDGRGKQAPLYLPEQRALVFADGMTAPGGECACGPRRGTRRGCCRRCEELLELPFKV